ncbi:MULTISPECIES: hypothetical protein [Acinetobacter]|uniref:Uncharacterized protein n=1 Tax=Acinetobacter pollinis TaxID=2605270 RepID=A0ABU6DUS1_9GAMM|nr:MULTISPECIES: hypothetical protein [Acinetobacter]MCF9034691.1 hypothetical protein [Acinetobacter nectaris]MEB5477611.1 hypothetical protein [Acinetobacter pollinis]
MIDLEKEKQEQELFKQKMLNEHSDYENEEEFEKDKHGDFAWIGTDSDFIIWEMCAEEKQKEISKLKQKLEKLESGEFVLVPREPAKEMFRVFYDAFNLANKGNTAQNFKVAYKAMIEAVEKDHE